MFWKKKLLSFLMVFGLCGSILTPHLAHSKLSLPADFEASERTQEAVAPKKLQQLTQLHEKAENYIVENQFRHAIEIYIQITLLEPDDDTAYANMGYAYMILGRADHAKEAFINALHIDPKNEIAYQGLISLYDPDSRRIYKGKGSASTQ